MTGTVNVKEGGIPTSFSCERLCILLRMNVTMYSSTSFTVTLYRFLISRSRRSCMESEDMDTNSFSWYRESARYSASGMKAVGCEPQKLSVGEVSKKADEDVGDDDDDDELGG